jgi:hypothetical protein
MQPVLYTPHENCHISSRSLFSSFLSNSFMVKLYKTIILPDILYECEICCVNRGTCGNIWIYRKGINGKLETITSGK